MLCSPLKGVAGGVQGVSGSLFPCLFRGHLPPAGPPQAVVSGVAHGVRGIVEVEARDVRR